jgi:VanZ family protein
MRKKHSSVLFVSYAMLVAFLSLQPGAGSSIGPYDKVAHFITYSIFALLALRLNLSGRQYMYVCIGIVAYSGLLEFAQSFVPGRVMSAFDLLANTLGVAFGVLLRIKYFAKEKLHEKV